MHEQGYAFISKLKPECSTELLVKQIGSLVKVSDYRGYEKIPDIQILKPRKAKENIQNQYSGHFGLNDFPLHTDLAHWLCPPRYIFLRCLHGSELVATSIIRNNFLLESLGENTIKKAVVRPRKRSMGAVNCVLLVFFFKSGMKGIRWDSLFLVPMNNSSTVIGNLVVSKAINKNVHHEYLVNTGDTVIIDNWAMLHGR